MAEIKKRLEEIAADEIEQPGIVAQVKDNINKKKAEIAEVDERIASLRERMF